MKKSIEVVKSEIRAKLLFWNNIQSTKVKVGLILLFIDLILLFINTNLPSAKLK